MRRIMLLAFLVVISLLAGVSWAAPVIVSNCTVIDSNGSYILNQGISGAPINASPSGNACIKINASDVIFDCNNFVLTDNGTPESFGIFITGVQNVTVSNCVVNAYSKSGIKVDNSNSTLLSSNQALGNGEMGFNLENANNNNLSSNVAQFNNLSGFALIGSSNNTLDLNTASANNQNNIIAGDILVGGFLFIQSSSNTLTRNFANFNSQSGMAFQLSSTGNNISGNYFIQNSQYGIYVDASNNNAFSGNTVGNNLVIGFYLKNSTGTTLAQDDFSNLFAIDFFINSSSAATVRMTNVSFGFTNNRMSLNDSTLPGDSYSINSPFPPAELPPSYSSINKLLDITSFSNNPIIDRIVMNWDDSELGPVDENTLELWKYNKTWTNTNAARNTSTNTLRLTNFNPSSIYAILYPVQATPVSSCSEISVPGEYFLDQDISGADFLANETGLDFAFACIKIISQGVVFDCRGNSITYENFFNSIGVFVFAPNVMVKNCNVQNYSYGLYLLSGIDNRFVNNTIVNNTGGDGAGIFLINSQGTSLQNNTVANNDAGVHIQDSMNTLLENEHYFGNKHDFIINLNPAFPDNVNVNMVKSIFDNPSGNFRNFTTLSISDEVSPGEELSVDWLGRPFPPEISIPPLPSSRLSFKEMFVIIAASPNNLFVDNITWHWTDADSSGLNEDSFELWRIGPLNLVWANFQASRNTAENTLSLINKNPGENLYAFTYSGTGPQPNQTGGCALVSMSFTPNCTENVITFFANNYPFIGANVTIVRNGTNISKGLTDAAGKIRFKAIGGDIKILIKKENLTAGECYQIPGGSLISTLVSEAQCAEQNPPCEKNSDCKTGQVCVNRTCVAPYVPPPPPPPPTAPKCVKDTDCSPSEFCRLGFCALVSGTCGHVSNHTWVSYECCSDTYCTDGKTCISNKCVLARYRLLGDTTGFVGDRKSMAVFSDSKPFPNAQLKVTNPDNSFVVLSTDASGKVTLLLTQRGEYTVELLVNGKLFGKLLITSMPRELPSEVPKPSDILSQTGIVVILVILVAAVAFSIYEFFFRHKKKTKKR